MKVTSLAAIFIFALRIERSVDGEEVEEPRSSEIRNFVRDKIVED